MSQSSFCAVRMRIGDREALAHPQSAEVSAKCWRRILYAGTLLGFKGRQPTQKSTHPKVRKRGGVQKSMGNKVPWKTGMLIYLPVTSRPLISLQKEAFLSPCIFATTRLAACILNFYLPWTSRPMKRRTLSQRPERTLPYYKYCDAWVRSIVPPP